MDQEKIEGAKVYSASEARKNFSDILDSAHFGEPVVVKKRGRTVAVVAMSFLERLAELEAALDAESAQKSLDEFNDLGGKSMMKIKQELGMD